VADRIVIDTDERVITIQDGATTEVLALFSKAGLEVLTRVWIKVQWNQLNWRSLSWQGFPIWQLPDDVLRLQETIFRIAPDVIVETGVNQGGSSVFFASLCRLMGKGRVISIDIHIPTAVRDAVADSPYADLIALIESDSTDPGTVERVRRLIGKGNRTFFFLDSDHSKAHVLNELRAYAGLVSPGSYIVAADGVMRTLHDTPNGLPGWREDNPAAAAREFVRTHPQFIIETPRPLFGQEYVVRELTYWPDGWILRKG
jgi:cephalosporin hydroxylase